MYVCMSENLYPARLKRKRHSRAAVSNKQKRLQCPISTVSRVGRVGRIGRVSRVSRVRVTANCHREG